MPKTWFYLINLCGSKHSNDVYFLPRTAYRWRFTVKPLIYANIVHQNLPRIRGESWSNSAPHLRRICPDFAPKSGQILARFWTESGALFAQFLTRGSGQNLR